MQSSAGRGAARRGALGARGGGAQEATHCDGVNSVTSRGQLPTPRVGGRQGNRLCLLGGDVEIRRLIGEVVQAPTY